LARLIPALAQLFVPSLSPQTAAKKNTKKPSSSTASVAVKESD